MQPIFRQLIIMTSFAHALGIVFDVIKLGRFQFMDKNWLNAIFLIIQ